MYAEAWKGNFADGFQNIDPDFGITYSRSQYLAGAPRNYSPDATMLLMQSVFGTAATRHYSRDTSIQLHLEITTVLTIRAGSLSVVATNLPFAIGFAGAQFSKGTSINFA